MITVAIISRKPYPTDASDEEWSFVAPYLCLLSEEASQRRHDLREIFITGVIKYLTLSGGNQLPEKAFLRIGS